MLEFDWNEGTVQEFLDAVEVYKIRTNNQPEDQAKGFSKLVIFAIKGDRIDLLEALLEKVKNNEEFNYLNTKSNIDDNLLHFVTPLCYYCEEIILSDDSIKQIFSISIIDPYRPIKLLLDKGANPNVLNDQGNTPLHEVCSARCSNIVELRDNNFRAKCCTKSNRETKNIISEQLLMR